MSKSKTELIIENGKLRTSYSASGLPAGLRLNAETGEITGTPTTAGASLVAIDWEQYNKDEAAERAKREGYRAQYYTGLPCNNCERNRVMNCVNGRKICEKCGWDQESKSYSDYLTP